MEACWASTWARVPGRVEYSLLSFGSRSLHACPALSTEREGGSDPDRSPGLGWRSQARACAERASPTFCRSPLTSHSLGPPVGPLWSYLQHEPVPTPESPSIRSEAPDSCSFPLGKCLEVKGLSLRFNPRAEVVLPPVESNRHRALQTLFQAMCCPRPRGRKEGTLES